MYTKIYSDPDIYNLYVPLPDNPLKNLNCYIIKTDDRSLVIDTGFNRPECLEAMTEGLKELDIDPHPSHPRPRPGMTGFRTHPQYADPHHSHPSCRAQLSPRAKQPARTLWVSFAPAALNRRPRFRPAMVRPKTRKWSALIFADHVLTPILSLVSYRSYPISRISYLVFHLSYLISFITATANQH